MTRNNNFLIILSIIAAAQSAIFAAKIGNRIANPTPLIDCNWVTTGGSNNNREFKCEAKSTNVQFATTSQQTAADLQKFGAGGLAGQRNTIDVHVTTTADYTCLVVAYCLSGENARISIQGEFSSSTTKEQLWSRQMTNNGGEESRECREIVQTIYDKNKKPHNFMIATVTAELSGLPSAFFFERVNMYEGACKVRIEGDYYREYEQFLTSNSESLENDKLHGDKYLRQPEPQPFVNKWPNGVVSYVLSLSPSRTQTTLNDAFKAIEDVSCVNFTELAQPPTAYYFEISDAKEGCFTEEIGIGEKSRVVMNLGSACWNQQSVILHQLMHVLGFSHESNRVDRDFYVQVNSANIEPGKLFEFDLHDPTVATFTLPYDYMSIMHFKDTYFATAGAKTLVGVRDKAAQLGGDVLSELDKKRIQTAYCSKDLKNYGCASNHCPYDSICSDKIGRCKCMTEPNGNPGSCMGLMENHYGRNCGPSLSTFGKLVQVGNFTLSLCICKKDGSVIENGTCPMVTTREEPSGYDKETRNNLLGSTRDAGEICSFGYRQLPTGCDPVPEAVQLTMSATSLLITDNLEKDKGVIEFAGLNFSELIRWDDKLLDTNSELYWRASQVVRFEVLRALSIIYFGDDSLVTKTTGFQTSSQNQEPWVNLLNSVQFSKSSSLEAKFDIRVLVYFTQPIHFSTPWLQARLISIFGLDGAERDNGFIFVRGKKRGSLIVDGDACRNFARANCKTDEYCQRGYTAGKLAMCVVKKVDPEPTTPARPTFAPVTTPALPTTAAPTTTPPKTEPPKPTTAPTDAPTTPKQDSVHKGLTDLEIALIVTSSILGSVIIVILFSFCCCKKKHAKKDNEEVEMAPVAQPQVVVTANDVQPQSPPSGNAYSPVPTPTSPVAAQPQHYVNEGYYSPVPGTSGKVASGAEGEEGTPKSAYF